jgi:hypothetical protein
MTPELIEHLCDVLDEHIARCEDHIAWLLLRPSEPDQLVATEEAIARSERALASLATPSASA